MPSIFLGRPREISGRASRGKASKDRFSGFCCRRGKVFRRIYIYIASVGKIRKTTMCRLSIVSHVATAATADTGNAHRASSVLDDSCRRRLTCGNVMAKPSLSIKIDIAEETCAESTISSRFTHCKDDAWIFLKQKSFFSKIDLAHNRASYNFHIGLQMNVERKKEFPKLLAEQERREKMIDDFLTEFLNSAQI